MKQGGYRLFAHNNKGKDMTVRQDVLDKAKQIIMVDRSATHGKPEDSFKAIADLWNGYLGIDKIKPHDVGALMMLLKVARFKGNPYHLDNMIDAAGYAACAAELAMDGHLPRATMNTTLDPKEE